MLFGLAELVPLLEQVVLSTVREEMKRGSEGFFPLINMEDPGTGEEKSTCSDISIQAKTHLYMRGQVLEAPFSSYRQNTNASLNYHQQRHLKKEKQKISGVRATAKEIRELFSRRKNKSMNWLQNQRNKV